MKQKHSFMIHIFMCLAICLSIYLIYIGSSGLALTPRQDVFTIKLNQSVKTDPGYYFKGVTDPDRVKIDFSKVNTKKAGKYPVKVKQSSRHYEFTIKVTK